MPKRACNVAVTAPAVAPVSAPQSVATSGPVPLTISIAAVAPPSVNEPSTVKSSKATTR